MKRNCMTQKELADRWTISHRTLERWRWAGEGPAYMKLGGRVVYRVWQAKFAANVARDSAVRGALLDEGWRVATIWECALRKHEQVSVATDRLSDWLVAVGDTLELGENEASAQIREGEDTGSSR